MVRQQKRERGGDDDRPGVWKAYGRVVKLLRDKAGLTQQQLADAVGYSVEQVASIEQGRRAAKPAFTKAAEEVLDAGGVLDAMQEDVDLARLPAFFQDVAMIEGDATTYCWFGNDLIPGLLQIEDYTRAVFGVRCPPLTDDETEQLLEARMQRQLMLTRTPTVDVSFIIGESVLRCPIGGRDVLKAQLAHLRKQMTLPNVDIQIMPLSYGAHVGVSGPMILLETREHRRVAYIESQGIGQLVSDPKKVSTLAMRYGKLRTQALNAFESAKFVERIEGEL
ncbi:helix-turn-helix transcriptional regulator [Yinghuangia sp. ASG 101]|uniref:helix-turn-helix domain-containing protein n=1 Tax=Yinghuangia sp. ASG 101 TaxID=2896848 RepID=UPI001E45257F|nr:helix-turn-helix transcriptional regulator [Yinghuangia sp. ASG 101]UGQ11284.1 helix-turn-helix transcriptional regulator [Yinghuangia sp. ASG 101]